MPPTGRVFVVGSINTDLVAYVERLPEPGETVGGARFAETAGGKGANQAVAAARAGASCVLHGAVGDDAYGRARVDDLAGAAVVTEHVAVLPEERSGVALISVDTGGENQIAVAPGANGAFRFGRGGVLRWSGTERRRAAAERDRSECDDGGDRAGARTRCCGDVEHSSRVDIGRRG